MFEPEGMVGQRTMDQQQRLTRTGLQAGHWAAIDDKGVSL